MRNLLILLLLASLALAGCTESDAHCDDGHVDDECPGATASTDPTPTNSMTPPQNGPTTHEVGVEDNSFSPDTITVAIGDTVRWNQTGSNPHTVTAEGMFDSHPNCNTFVDGQLGNCMAQGDSFEYTFDTAGEYTVYCKLHGNADGSGHAMTITVA